MILPHWMRSQQAKRSTIALLMLACLGASLAWAFALSKPTALEQTVVLEGIALSIPQTWVRRQKQPTQIRGRDKQAIQIVALFTSDQHDQNLRVAKLTSEQTRDPGLALKQAVNLLFKNQAYQQQIPIRPGQRALLGLMQSHGYVGLRYASISIPSSPRRVSQAQGQGSKVAPPSSPKSAPPNRSVLNALAVFTFDAKNYWLLWLTEKITLKDKQPRPASLEKTLRLHRDICRTAKPNDYVQVDAKKIGESDAYAHLKVLPTLLDQLHLKTYRLARHTDSSSLKHTTPLLFRPAEPQSPFVRLRIAAAAHMPQDGSASPLNRDAIMQLYFEHLAGRPAQKGEMTKQQVKNQYTAWSLLLVEPGSTLVRQLWYVVFDPTQQAMLLESLADTPMHTQASQWIQQIIKHLASEQNQMTQKQWSNTSESQSPTWASQVQAGELLAKQAYTKLFNQPRINQPRINQPRTETVYAMVEQDHLSGTYNIQRTMLKQDEMNNIVSLAGKDWVGQVGLGLPSMIQWQLSSKDQAYLAQLSRPKMRLGPKVVYSHKRLTWRDGQLTHYLLDVNQQWQKVRQWPLGKNFLLPPLLANWSIKALENMFDSNAVVWMVSKEGLGVPMPMIVHYHRGVDTSLDQQATVCLKPVLSFETNRYTLNSQGQVVAGHYVNDINTPLGNIPAYWQAVTQATLLQYWPGLAKQIKSLDQE